MAFRYFELTENVPFEDERELHAQFKLNRHGFNRHLRVI